MFGLIYSASVRFEPKTSRSESRRSTNWAYRVYMYNTCRETSFWIEILSFVAVEIGKRTKQENQNNTGKKWTDCLSTFLGHHWLIDQYGYSNCNWVCPLDYTKTNLNVCRTAICLQTYLYLLKMWQIWKWFTILWKWPLMMWINFSQTPHQL